MTLGQRSRSLSRSRSKWKKIKVWEICWNVQKIENYNFKIFIQIRKNLEILWWPTFHTSLYEERLLSVDTVLDFYNMCFGMAMKWITRDQLKDLMVLTTEQFHNLHLYYNSISPSVCVCACVFVCHSAYSCKLHSWNFHRW